MTPIASKTSSNISRDFIKFNNAVNDGERELTLDLSALPMTAITRPIIFIKISKIESRAISSVSSVEEEGRRLGLQRRRWNESKVSRCGFG